MVTTIVTAAIIGVLVGPWVSSSVPWFSDVLRGDVRGATIEAGGTATEADGVLPDGATVLDAVRAAGAGDDERGVAVALDRSVVPRSLWGATPIDEGARIEVLRAVAGG